MSDAPPTKRARTAAPALDARLLCSPVPFSSAPPRPRMYLLPLARRTPAVAASPAAAPPAASAAAPGAGGAAAHADAAAATASGGAADLCIPLLRRASSAVSFSDCARARARARASAGAHSIPTRSQSRARAPLQRHCCKTWTTTSRWWATCTTRRPSRARARARCVCALCESRRSPPAGRCALLRLEQRRCRAAHPPCVSPPAPLSLLPAAVCADPPHDAGSADVGDPRAEHPRPLVALRDCAL